jgi:hypothetical protein
VSDDLKKLDELLAKWLDDLGDRNKLAPDKESCRKSRTIEI